MYTVDPNNLLDKRDSLEEMILYSFLVHVLIACLFILFSNFIWPNLFRGEVKIIESSIRVDVVAMPTMTMQELKEIESAASAAKDVDNKDSSTAKPKDLTTDSEINYLKEKKESNKKFLDTIGNLSKKKVTATSKIGKKEKEKLKALLLHGNKLSSGTRIVGDGKNNASGEYEEYAASIPDIIRPYWRLPDHLKSLELRARVRIFLSPNGEVIKSEVLESSGNNDYDLRVLNTIKSASPLPIVPGGAQARALRGDIVLGFPL